LPNDLEKLKKQDLTNLIKQWAKMAQEDSKEKDKTELEGREQKESSEGDKDKEAKDGGDNCNDIKINSETRFAFPRFFRPFPPPSSLSLFWHSFRLGCCIWCTLAKTVLCAFGHNSDFGREPS